MSVKFRITVSGPKVTLRSWLLILAVLVLFLASFLGVATLALYLPDDMFFPLIMTFFGLSYVALDSLRRRRNGGSLSYAAYSGAVVAIGGAIKLATLVTPQFTSQQHSLLAVVWGVVAFGVPIAWWLNNLEQSKSNVQSRPTA